MSCVRCQADPHPKMFGSFRRCAFDDAGVFTPDNWNCATISALLALDSTALLSGSDETLEAVYNSQGWHGGWIVLTRYKRRGCTSSAVLVGDFFPPQPLTLTMVERFITGEDWYPDGLPDTDDVDGGPREMPEAQKPANPQNETHESATSSSLALAGASSTLTEVTPPVQK